MSKLPPLGLYVHYPFCQRKCPYCDFNSYTKARYALQVSDSAYTQALRLELIAAKPLLSGRQFASVFIGGGTPSLWPLEEVNCLLTTLKAHDLLLPDAEISLEVNPGTAADAAYFAKLRACGVNRLSIGVQSFNDDHLKRLGRIHDSAVAKRSCAAARAAGFTQLNLDIMHGLPAQSVAQAMEDLATAAQYATHLSWYELTLEEDTVFGQHPPKLPDEDTLAEIEAHGFALLQQLQFKRYEISGFTRAKPCVHNLNYWRFGDYLGLGAGAHSKLSQCDASGQLQILRRADPALPEAYLKAALNNATALLYQGEYALTQVAAEDLPFEYMLNRLRLFEPVPLAEYCALTGLSCDTVLPALQPAFEDGRLQLAPDGKTLSVSAYGHLMLNSILELLLPR